MKKLFFFLAVAGMALTSCSGDDSSPVTSGTSSASATVNGVAKTFTTFSASTEDFPADGNYPAYTEVSVVGTNSANETVSFMVERGELGPVYGSFAYTQMGDVFYNYSSDFNVIVTVNNAAQLKGTFSGTLITNGGSGSVTVTNGAFDIHF